MKLLVCGTQRKKQPTTEIQAHLNIILLNIQNHPLEIIEGCCPDSADQIAEKWAKQHHIPITHFPSNSGNYLKRNIEMVEKCDEVLCFWDGFSYGSAQTIATAVARNKKVTVVSI